MNKPFTTIKSCYIAGPMRGLELFNFPAFDAAKARLLELGVANVMNPADFDRAWGSNPAKLPVDHDCDCLRYLFMTGMFNPAKLPVDHDWASYPDDLGPLEETVALDLEAVIKCEALALLPGWRLSRGARAEKAVAEWMGKRILYPRADGWEEFMAEAEIEEVAS